MGCAVAVPTMTQGLAVQGVFNVWAVALVGFADSTTLPYGLGMRRGEGLNLRAFECFRSWTSCVSAKAVTLRGMGADAARWNRSMGSLCNGCDLEERHAVTTGGIADRSVGEAGKERVCAR